MKKSLFRLAAMSLLALGACQQRELDPVIIVESRVMTFTAGLADEADTRTQFEFVDASTFNVQWSPNDAINIFYGDAGSTPGSRFESLNTEPAETATFTGTINSFTGLDESGEVYQFWGVYPYSTDNRCDGESVQVGLPTIQNAVAGNIDSNTTLMVAKASGLALPFYNVWAVFRVRLTNTDIKSITLRGNNGEIMSGRVSVTMGSDGKPVWTSIPGQGKTYVTLKAPEGTTLQNGQDYYIAFLPQTFSNGFTFSFHKSNGEFGSYKITSSQTLERSKRYNLLNKDGGTNVNYFGYVDMGNGLKIATVNIGGNSATDQGEEFAWGETTTKSSYDWDNYFWGTESALTKYTTADGKTALDPEDDPATVICGEDWRTPTPEEWATLVNNYTPNYNVIGRVSFQSASDATKSISFYMPQTGYSYYWSREIGSSSSSAYAFYVGINKSGNPQVGRTPTRARNKGSYIRPIFSRVYVMGVSLNKSTLKLVAGQNETLTAIIEPSNASKKNVRWESSDESVATVDENGTVTAIAEGEATIEVTTVDGECSASCDVTVYPAPSGEYVQMGSGQMWATCNLGAVLPEDPGDTYAWGEIETKDEYYWDNYRWMESGRYDGKYINKYQFPDGNLDACWYDNGVFSGDGRGVLQYSDDAARQNWGRSWRIPTRSDWEWLRENCDWVWDSEKKGYWAISQVSGYVGNRIFLPATRSLDDNPYGIYWSSTINGYNSTLASMMYLSQSMRTSTSGDRCLNHSIRPVYSNMVGVHSVSLNKTQLALYGSESETLIASVDWPSSTEKGVVWCSSNSDVATVSHEGVVTAQASGTATITVMTLDGCETATCAVTVYPAQSDQYVQMGPGQFWANSNLGATQPEEAGNLYAWGETETKTSSSWLSYTFSGGYDDGKHLTKYLFPDGNTSAVWYSGGSFNGDGLGVLQYSDDAARQKWGRSWRIPTRSDWEWLLDNCVWVWDDAKQGYLVISTVNGYVGKQIFLPMVDGVYWSSTLNGYNTMSAYNLVIDATRHKISVDQRKYSRAIRPVYSSKIDVTGISLSKTSLTLVGRNTTETLTATVIPSDASEKHVVWFSENPEVATVSADGIITAVWAGTANITAIIDQNKRATCVVTVIDPTLGSSGGHDWVDMGNGLKWATANVGASSETSYGDLFAWGETLPKDDYSYNTYSYVFATSSLSGYYDVATHWEGGWHMPTLQDWQWLVDSSNTTSVFVTNYKNSGINGRLFTSIHNGNTLFLPAAGDGYQTSNPNPGNYGSYWSSTSTSSTEIDKAYYMSFGQQGGNGNTYEDYRWYGKSVRPVSGSAQ